jgi:protein TonB
VWISLGLHAALIALVQVAPPPAVNLGEPVIEARLVPAHTAQPDAENPPAAEADAPEKLPDIPPQPLLAPSRAFWSSPPTGRAVASSNAGPRHTTRIPKWMWRRDLTT